MRNGYKFDQMGEIWLDCKDKRTLKNNIALDILLGG